MEGTMEKRIILRELRKEYCARMRATFSSLMLGIKWGDRVQEML